MSIAAATDWFLVQKQQDGETSIRRIACWWEQTDGTVTVIGLFGLPFSAGQAPRLAWPADLGGIYKHLSELTPEELRQYKQTTGDDVSRPG